jgi:homoserine dehydrogenase
MADVVVIGSGTVGSELQTQLKTAGHTIRAVMNRSRVLFSDGSETSCKNARNAMDVLTEYARDVEAVMIAIPNRNKGIDELNYMQAFRGKHLITCAKAAHAYQYEAVRELGQRVGCRASVGGGTDMLEVLRRRHLQHEDVTIHAVVNGTLNHVWSTIQTGGSFAEAVSDAKDLKYAEPGNSDLVGIINEELLDVAMKCSIIKNVALPSKGRPISPEDFKIVALKADDIKRLTSRNARYRFITTFSSVEDVDEIEVNAPGSVRAVCGRWRITGGFHDVRAESPWFDWLREIGGVKNGFVIHNALCKDTGNSLTGPGAGPVVTAKAMMRDLHDFLEA